MIVVSSIKNQPLKTSDFTAVVQQEGNKCKRSSHENSSFDIFLILEEKKTFVRSP